MNIAKLASAGLIAGALSIGTAFAYDLNGGGGNLNGQAYAPAHAHALKQGWGGHDNSVSSKLQPYDGSAAPRG